MIDLHCHVLPGVDDGPASIDEAVALARQAASEGIDTIIATPHVSPRYPNTSEVIGPGVALLNERLAAEQVGVEVRQGAELAATAVLDLQPDELGRLTLGGGPWLLLEPPFTHSVAGLDSVVLALMQQGHGVVIAHPERCPGFHRDAGTLGALVRAGALTSITAGSLVGKFGGQVRRFATRLLEEELVHNVATDAHNSQTRRSELRADISEARVPDGLAEWLTEFVPAAILEGGQIPPRPQHLQRATGIGRLGRGLLGRVARR